MTPRLKFFIFFKKFKLLLLFFKIRFFSLILKIESWPFGNFDQTLTPYFFYNFYFKILKFFSYKVVEFYFNNLTKSMAFFCLRALANFSYNKFFAATSTFSYVENGLDAQYLQPVVISNSTLSFDNFKNFFYFKFFFLTVTWYQHNLNLKFYLNFLPLLRDLFILPIFSGFFFKIHRL